MCSHFSINNHDMFGTLHYFSNHALLLARWLQFVIFYIAFWFVFFYTITQSILQGDVDFRCMRSDASSHWLLMPHTNTHTPWLSCCQCYAILPHGLATHAIMALSLLPARLIKCPFAITCHCCIYTACWHGNRRTWRHRSCSTQCKQNEV